MIKKLVLGFFILFSSFSFGQEFAAYGPQTRFWGTEFQHSYYKQRPEERELIKEKQVKSRENIRYEKGNPVVTTEFFDNRGRLIARERDSQNGTPYKATFAYDDHDNMIEFKSVNAKNQESITTYTFDEDNRQINRETVNFKGLYTANKVSYNAQGKIAFRRIYKKDKENPVKELVYTYYENGDPKLTEYYEKGKLKHSWKYDCKPEGELINVKNKDATTLCKIEEVDDSGNRTVWERKFDEKGRLSKTKTVYAVDSLIITKERYNSSEKLVYRSEYAYDKNRTRTGIETFYFDKAGEAYLAKKTVYTESHGTQSTGFDKKGKVQYTTQYVMNDARKIVKSQRLDGKWSHTYLYNYQDDLIHSEVRIFKNNTYVSEFVYDYY